MPQQRSFSPAASEDVAGAATTAETALAAQMSHDPAQMAQEKKKKERRPTGSKGKKQRSLTDHSERRVLTKTTSVGLAGDPHSLDG